MQTEHLIPPPPAMEREVDAAIVGAFWPGVRDWWRGKFSHLSLPQRLAVPSIAAGEHTLVCAPTGTGKTLCAFISILSDLLARNEAGTLQEAVDTVYISPLRALGTDIARNLELPLQEMAPGGAGGGGGVLRVARRTGDTPAKERSAMVRRPPHILITTPESLALCLANAGMRDHLTRVRRIIVDELHALVPNKRGTDLMLSMERLADLVTARGGRDPQRIGLSATIAPLERMAEFLVGADGGPGEAARTCAIADASFHRPLDLSIASVFGKTPFVPTAAINRNVYDFLEKTIRAHRTTLVFTNLRAATERVTFALRKRFAAAVKAGENHAAAIIAPEQIEAHHSSLDRDVRLQIERRLKAGELRCVVCSTSLELGIDIGTIDRVVLLNSPKGVARGLQRVGRSGHSLDATAMGTFIPTVPADLLEAMVTADAMRKRQVDAIDYPKNPLDVLAQHLIGMALQHRPDGIHTDHAYAIVRRTAPYAKLTREMFDQVMRYVATQDLRDTARVDAKLWLEPTDLDEAEEYTPGEQADARTGDVFAGADASDGRWLLADDNGSPPAPMPPVQGLLHPLRASIGGLYAQNVGTITQEGQVKVRIREGGVIGTVEEAFAQLLKVSDRFVLGGRCVQVVGSKGMTVEVTECNGQAPTIPRWYSGTMSMEPGLTGRMREFRGKVRAIAPAGVGAISRMLTRQYSVSEETARAAAAYLHAQFRYADIPVDGQLLVERVPDEGGGVAGTEATVLVFHTMIGRAANEALARAVAYRMHRRFGGSRNEAIDQGRGGGRGGMAVGGATVVVDDHAFGIWVDATTAAKRADRTLVRSLLSPVNLEEDLAAAVETSDLFRTQFRYTAIRAHALLQNKFGRKRFIGQMQSYATRLYEALKEYHPDHLLLRETRRTVMEDLLCAPAARAYLERLAGQNLRLVDLPSPSPFAFGLFAAGSARRDTLQLADTADFLLAMYEQVQRRLKSEAAPQTELFS